MKSAVASTVSLADQSGNSGRLIVEAQHYVAYAVAMPERVVRRVKLRIRELLIQDFKYRTMVQYIYIWRVRVLRTHLYVRICTVRVAS